MRGVYRSPVYQVSCPLRKKRREMKEKECKEKRDRSMRGGGENTKNKSGRRETHIHTHTQRREIMHTHAIARMECDRIVVSAFVFL